MAKKQFKHFHDKPTLNGSEIFLIQNPDGTYSKALITRVGNVIPLKSITGETIKGSGDIIPKLIPDVSIVNGEDNQILFQSAGKLAQSKKLTFDGALNIHAETDDATTYFIRLLASNGIDEVLCVNSIGDVDAKGQNVSFGKDSSGDMVLTLRAAAGAASLVTTASILQFLAANGYTFKDSDGKLLSITRSEFNTASESIHFSALGGCRIGNDGDKLSFYGASPVELQLLPTTATTLDVIKFLHKIGLAKKP